MKKAILDILNASIEVKRAITENEQLISEIERSINAINQSLEQGGRILFCGNGGSAADAQHIAAELTGRFYIDRPPLDAEALHVNSSYLTAVANDYEFNEAYARLVRAKGRPGDILVALSTSGNSRNVILAAQAARDLNMFVIGMSGLTGGNLASLCDICINVPSKDTPRIQEAHITIGHILCQQVEQHFFG